MTKPSHSRILVAGGTPAEIANLLPFARKLSEVRGELKLVLGLVTIPASESLSSGTRAAQELRRELAPLPRHRDTRIVVRVTYDFWDEIEAVVKSEGPSLLLLNYSILIPYAFLKSVACDLVLANGAWPARLRHILLPIRGGPHAMLALQVARALAQSQKARITMLHATPPGRFRKTGVRELYSHLETLPEVKQRVRAEGDPASAILTTAATHQLLVMGAIANPQRGDPPIGPTATRIVQEAPITSLIVKIRSDNPVARSTVDYTISVVVDKWFAENTFHAHEFQDIRKLVALKERQGLTISLGLPTLNEEETIGSVIRTMRRRFVEQYPLLDEIVVIDSLSKDRTVEIARAMGVAVVNHPDILPEQGSWRGKGEALWKSLCVLRGDLIAWIDTDIINIHPRFVYGILGPLIREPHLQYVKGFYQRPLRLGGKVEARGGGRVTELVARPLFNLLYPQLSGWVQPLAGEYAGRRAALESVPFFAGYGVETGLLIDIWSRYGLQAMGQVDLEERVHRNQSLMALSKMSFEIVQVFMQRVGDKRGVELLDEMNKSMKLIRYESDAFHLDVAEIRARERPPINTIPEYQKWRKAR